MNAYAQNASGDGGGYASLSGSLLARKGEALPAVDAVAHEGVDIEMRPMRPANSPGAPKNISEKSIESLRETGAASDSEGQTTETELRETPYLRQNSAVRLVHSTPDAPTQESATPSPDAWKIMTMQTRAAARARLTSQAASAQKNASDRMSGVRKAICKLRMPAPELVRLKYASRDLDMSCQAIILEALECYLDANDMPPVTDDVIQEEVTRLLAKARK
ncbi:hypothetical protein PUV54_03410 [Hyphococcus flavus]|uniref:Uncharacterized protein n=1 Tax=Hyphococcus flavus TaxID=1866326 RepID=A0AAE9ZEG1_9PROT|nr:hypothetical protein [Hyphococcus flavus]WDI32240.1 hypothetical protein PUV54_03410 [Hyphococcus flavus]